MKVINEYWNACYTSFFSQFAYSAEKESDVIAKKIVRLSGIGYLISTIPEQFETQFSQNGLITNDIESENEVRDTMISAFDKKKSNELILYHILSSSSFVDMKKILAWLESSLGRRISDAEMEAGSAKGQANIIRYTADMRSNPLPQDRIKLIQYFESVAKITDLTLMISEVGMKGMFEAANEIEPKDIKKSKEELDEYFNTTFAGFKTTMEPVVRKEVLLGAYYAYRNFSDDEINQYSLFLTSDTGKIYTEYGKGVTLVYRDMTGAAVKQLLQRKSRNKMSHNE